MGRRIARPQLIPECKRRLTAYSCGDMCIEPPTPCRVARTLRRVGELLGDTQCFYSRGRFHFPLGAGWSIAVAPESAGRFRIECCHLSRPRTTLWSLDGEDDHLAGVILELTRMVNSRFRDEMLEKSRLP